MCSAQADVRFVPIADMVFANPKQASYEPNGSSILNPNLCYSANGQGANMRRRQFIVMLGVAGVWPLLAQAQQPTAPVIGLMSGRSPDESKPLVAACPRGLREGGFVEGKNIAVEYRWASPHDRLPALAAELVEQSCCPGGGWRNPSASGCEASDLDPGRLDLIGDSAGF